jgi:Ni/Co efflux regulator RcnB
MKKILLCAVAFASIAAGCASTQSTTEPATERVEREYATGSNIPKKTKAGAADGVSVSDREALERARNQMPMTPRPGLGGTQ